MQLATPDRLRGRVTAINALFVGSSNQLGAVRAGFVAEWTSAVFSVVSGGVICLGIVGAVAGLMPELRRYRIDGRHRTEAEIARDEEREAATAS